MMRQGRRGVKAPSVGLQERAGIVALAARHAVPTMYQVRDLTAAGGLISYGPSIADLYRSLCPATVHKLVPSHPPQILNANVCLGQHDAQQSARSLSLRCGEVQPANHSVADVSVKKFRVLVLRAREYAIATAQAEMARIAARRLAALPPGWNRKSVVSSRRSAAVALCSCPSSLMPCLPPFSMVSPADS